MSYDITAAQTNFVGGWIDDGQFVQLGNLRLSVHNFSSGVQVRLATASGTTNVWHSARQTYYNNNVNGYAVYISPVTTTPKAFNCSEMFSNSGDCCQYHFTDGIHAYRAFYMYGTGKLANYVSLENLSIPHASGMLGIPKINQWVFGDGVVTFGNLKVRVQKACNLHTLQHQELLSDSPKLITKEAHQ